MTGFSYDLKIINNTEAELVLSGYMDEETVLPDPNELKTLSLLVINFRQVKSVLSIGIKLWIKFSGQIEDLPNLKIEFKDCSKQVVDQINLVEGFLPKNAHVTSIFVPVFCEKCNRPFKVLKKTDGIREEIKKVVSDMQEVDCQEFPMCKENYELEVNPDSYLRFLKN